MYTKKTYSTYQMAWWTRFETFAFLAIIIVWVSAYFFFDLTWLKIPWTPLALIGTAVATFFTGSPFKVNLLNQVDWENPYRGLELAFNFARYDTYINLSLGLAVFFLARVLAILFFMKTVDDKNITGRFKKQLINNAAPFLFFFLFFLTNVLMMKGYAVDPESKMVFTESYKYMHNLLQMPYVFVMLIVGVIFVILGIVRPLMDFDQCHKMGIWTSGIGTIITVFSLFLLAGFNNTAFYPSYTDIQSSLTIENASSSHYTLTAMTYVSLMVPFVIAYIWYAWRALTRKKITAKEMEEESHIY